MNRSRALLVFAVVLATAVAQLTGAERAGAPVLATFNDIGAVLTGVSYSSAAWGDYNSDGKLDILLTGYNGSGFVSKIYENNGNGTFAEDTTADSLLKGVATGSVAWGDYNSDGKLDILLTGDTGSGYVSKIYRNNGGNPVTFSEIPFTVGGGLTGVAVSSVAWGDYNSDGKPDILLTGDTGLSSGPVSKIYRNNGYGTFTEDTTADSGLAGVSRSSAAWGDYNLDGKLDIVLTGNDAAINQVAKLYTQDGSGVFQEDTAAEADVADVGGGSVAWGDYNSDGKPDLLLTGYDPSAGYVAKIYQNNGNGTFAEDTTADSLLEGVATGSAAWGDYNSDGRPDILLSGINGTATLFGKLYQNNGDGVAFSDIAAGLTPVWISAAAWGDFGNDGKLDILLTGCSGIDSGGTCTSFISKVYENGTATANTAPTAPSSLSASFASGAENLSWNATSDDHTPAAALTYNLRVGTVSGGSDVVSPLSLAGGTRLVPQDGNVGEHTSYKLRNLAAGTYSWSVQAVDSGFAGSPFASEGTFTVPPPAFSLSSAGYSVSEGDGHATVTINRTGSIVPASVHFATTGGTATAGSDYTAVSQTVSFASGETSKTVSVPIIDDSQIEGSETVQLSLSSPSAGATLGSPSSATLTIADNDRAFAFSSPTYSVGEAGPAATVTINRAGLTSGTDTVHFASANGTATAGSDYTAVSQTVAFAPGQTSKTVSIPITDDTVYEASETVLLSISSPSAGATLGSPSSATLTIVDNDVAPPPRANGRIASAKLSKKSFPSSQARKVKLSCKFSPKSKVFRYVLSLKKGKKWAVVKNVRKTGSFTKLTRTVKQLFAGKPVKHGSYRLKLFADKSSKTLGFKVT